MKENARIAVIMEYFLKHYQVQKEKQNHKKKYTFPVVHKVVTKNHEMSHTAKDFVILVIEDYKHFLS